VTSATTPGNGRRIGLQVARVLASVLLIVALFTKADPAGFVHALADANLRWLLVAMLLLPLAILGRIVSFMVLVNRQERILNLRQAAYLTLVGAGVGLFLPVAVGDLLKARLAWQAHGSSEDMMTATVVDKLTSVAAVAAMGFVGALVTREFTLAALAGVVTIVSSLPFVFPRIVPWRLALRVVMPRQAIDEERLRAVIRTSGPLLAGVLAISTLGWALSYSMIYAVCRALGAHVAVGYVFATAPFMALVSLLPISLGGIGPGQVTLSALLARAGVPVGLAVRVSLLQLGLTIVPALLGLIIYVVRPTVSVQPTETLTPEIAEGSLEKRA